MHWWHWLFWWRPPCLLRSVLVTLKHDDSTYQGVLWTSRGSWLTFRKVAMLKANLPPTPMDGDLIVHRSNVAFLQVVG